MAKVAWKQSKPSEFVAVVDGDAKKEMRVTALNLYNQIVALSPVDTGRFRANNLVSFDQPTYETTDSLAVDGAVSLKILNAPDTTKRIFIQNNLPYAERLENGWSQQSPLGIYKVSFELIAGR